MPRRSETLADLFFRGRYAQLLDRSYDVGAPFTHHAEVSYVIGALAFQGRIEEAESLLESRKELFTPADKLRARFFLALALCRQSNFSRAAERIGESFRDRRASLSHEDRFFHWQGLGFVRYMTGRFREALVCARRALEHAVAADFAYGRVLANDLFGHAQVQTGSISRGLKTLSVAESLATRIGSVGVAGAIRSARLIYRVRFGLQARPVEELEKEISRLEAEDSYTRAELLLALSRLLLLRGDATAANERLGEACRMAYASNNVPQRVTANVQLADLAYRRGDSELARSLAEKSAELARTYGNPHLELRARGMVAKAERALDGGMREETSRLVEELTRRTGAYPGSRILGRSRPVGFGHDFDVGEDPIGDLFDLMESRPPQAILEILRSGYLGLLATALATPTREPSLFVGLIPGELLVMHQGDVERRSGITPMLRRLCEALAGGEVAKEDLAQRFFPEPYHPLRHDPPIYSLVSKLRKILGPKASWLETTEGGYRFSPEIRVRLPDVPPAPSEEPISSAGPARAALHALNQRQLTLLHQLRQTEFIDVQFLVKRFAISEATAQRDLSALCEKGLISRVGRGRATSYRATSLPAQRP